MSINRAVPTTTASSDTTIITVTTMFAHVYSSVSSATFAAMSIWRLHFVLLSRLLPFGMPFGMMRYSMPAAYAPEPSACTLSRLC